MRNMASVHSSPSGLLPVGTTLVLMVCEGVDSGARCSRIGMFSPNQDVQSGSTCLFNALKGY